MCGHSVPPAPFIEYTFFLLSMFLESASNYMYVRLGLWLTFYAGFLWNFPIGFIVLYCQFQQFQNFFSWLFIWLIYHSILHPMTFMTLWTYWKFACFWFCFMALYSGGIHGVIRIFLKWLRFVCVYVFQGVACFRENSMDWWMACISFAIIWNTL